MLHPPIHSSLAFDPEGSYDEEDGGAGGPETEIQFIILLAVAIAVAILISIGLGVYGGTMGDMGNDEPNPENLDTDTLVLDTSDLGPEYRQTEETVTNTWNTTEEQQQLLTDHRILRTHSRIFTLDTNDTSPERNQPSFITSTVTVYRDAEAANQGLKRELDRLRQQGATVNKTTLQTGTNATAATYETDTGMKATALYHSRENVVYSITTTDPDTHFKNRASELLMKMGTNPT